MTCCTSRSETQSCDDSDFGLATSPQFELSAVERDFVERHVTHDAGYAAMRLVDWLVTDVCGIPILPSAGGTVAREYIVQCAAGRIPDAVPPVVAAILTRHAPAAAAKMNAFYWRLFDGQLHAEYPDISACLTDHGTSYGSST